MEKTVAIQRMARGMLARGLYEKSRSAVVEVQCFMRKCKLARKVGARVEEKRRVKGATLIQSLVRRAQAASVFREMLHEKKVDACIKIQALMRGKQARDDVFFNHFAATTIQKMWRGSTQQVSYMLMVLGSIKIQSFLRMVHAWEDFETKKIGARMIQRKWRSTMAKMAVKEGEAAVKIQVRMRSDEALQKGSVTPF